MEVLLSPINHWAKLKFALKHNGSLYDHVFFAQSGYPPYPMDPEYQPAAAFGRTYPVVKYFQKSKVDRKRSLLANSNDKGEAATEDSENAANPDSTLVVYMGLSTLPFLVLKLMHNGLPPDTPAAAVERGTTPQQCVISEFNSPIITQSYKKTTAPEILSYVLHLWQVKCIFFLIHSFGANAVWNLLHHWTSNHFGCNSQASFFQSCDN